MNDDREKRYTFPFSPGDWLHDIPLRQCSIAARGLWIDMLSIMHQGEPYGHLQINGKPVTTHQLAKLVQSSPKLISKLISELLHNGVISRSSTGLYYSRRMVRDQANRLINKENGKKGGNPKLVNPVNQGVNPPVNTPVIPSLPLPLPLPSTSTPNTLVATDVATSAKIPYEELRTTYNERRGALPEARPFSDAAKQKIKTRWRAHSDLEFWKILFAKAGKSERMVTWADFHWFMKSELNVEKTMNGNYDNDREKKSVPPPKLPPMPRERKLTAEEEEVNAREATKFFGDFKKKKRGGALVSISEVIPSVMKEEEIPV